MNYHRGQITQPIGIIISHGNNPNDWRGPLLTAIANYFARKGHIVARYHCTLKEGKKKQILEKTLETAARFPFSRNILKWIVLGHGNGARVAASNATPDMQDNRWPIAGFVFLSYPLFDPMPRMSSKEINNSSNDSTGPLLNLNEYSRPVLFINGELDGSCPGADLKTLAATSLLNIDTRAVIIPDVGPSFTTTTSTTAAAAAGTKEEEEEDIIDAVVLKEIVDTIDIFLIFVSSSSSRLQDQAVSAASASLPKLADMIPSSRVPPRPVGVTPESPEPSPTPPSPQQEGGGGEGGEMVTMMSADDVVNPMEIYQNLSDQYRDLQRIKGGNGDMLTEEQMKLEQSLQMAMLQQQQQLAAYNNAMQQ
jgi:hypothetical protein